MKSYQTRNVIFSALVRKIRLFCRVNRKKRPELEPKRDWKKQTDNWSFPGLIICNWEVG
jgi:hypothetical protein